MKKAFITGCLGQDGSYMAELLLEKGYEVHGLFRRISNPNFENIEAIKDKIHLHEGDMGDGTSLNRLIAEIKPDEVYNFAAMAGVTPSFKQPEYTLDIGANAVFRLLEAMRIHCPQSKFFQATSSHVFGNTLETPQTEKTKFQPISPYGIAKATAHHILQHYKESYGMFCCSAIFYAHASPRYSKGFLLSKVVHGIWDILDGKTDKLELGNLDVPMDIGYAKEYVEAAFNIMQRDNPDDFIIATGETHTSREFVECAFSAVGLCSCNYLRINDLLRRPSEVGVLVGDYSKAKQAFNFEPKIKFKELVELCVQRKPNKIS